MGLLTQLTALRVAFYPHEIKCFKRKEIAMASLAMAGQRLAEIYPSFRKYPTWNKLLIRTQEWFPLRLPIGVMAHVPKTGGTALRNWIRDQLGMWGIPSQRFDLASGPPSGDYVLYTGHMRCDFPQKTGLFSPGELADTFTFLMTRNPYERAVSLYFHFARHGGFEQTFCDFLQILAGSREGISDRSAQRIRTMGKPMVNWLGDAEPRNVTVFRYEEFDRATATLKKALGLTGSPAVVGRAPESQNKKVIGEQEAMLMQTIYAEDFERFGYSLSVPKELQLSRSV